MLTLANLSEGDAPTEGADDSLTSLPWEEMTEMVKLNDLSSSLCASKIEVFRAGEDSELKEWKGPWDSHPVFPLSGEELPADDHLDALEEEGVLRSSDQGDSSTPLPQAGMVASLLADPISDSPRQLPLRGRELFTNSPMKYYRLHHDTCDCTSVEFYWNEQGILCWRCPQRCLPTGSQPSNEELNSEVAVSRSTFLFAAHLLLRILWSKCNITTIILR